MAGMRRRRAQKLGLLLRRQSDGGVVGFASASRQRPLPSRSTTPRLANRPSRMETALLSQRVVFAHCTTPASGSSRIASSSTRSRAADSSTPGLKPWRRLEGERDSRPDRRRWALRRPFAPSRDLVAHGIRPAQDRVDSVAQRAKLGPVHRSSPFSRCAILQIGRDRALVKLVHFG